MLRKIQIPPLHLLEPFMKSASHHYSCQGLAHSKTRLALTRSIEVPHSSPRFCLDQKATCKKKLTLKFSQLCRVSKVTPKTTSNNSTQKLLKRTLKCFCSKWIYPVRHQGLAVGTTPHIPAHNTHTTCLGTAKPRSPLLAKMLGVRHKSLLLERHHIMMVAR